MKMNRRGEFDTTFWGGLMCVCAIIGIICVFVALVVHAHRVVDARPLATVVGYAYSDSTGVVIDLRNIISIEGDHVVLGNNVNGLFVSSGIYIERDKDAAVLQKAYQKYLSGNS